ncbi:MAG: hypothetical protein HC888_00330 [Candidatus Competibacteraceae bacterium]|nr:hypothetical protein [Candidatus Competibacteraceae bacterium]
MLRSYTELLDKHLGETAVILGAGPSLLEWLGQPNEQRDLIYRCVVIAVNSSFIITPWSIGEKDRRYWISNDSLCRRWSYWDILKAAKMQGIVRDSWNQYFPEIPDFLQFSPRPTSEGVINSGDTGLAYCSSVPSAIDLSIQMGCKKVVLLGIDHRMRHGKSHFWQFWPRDQQPRRTDNGMAPKVQQERVFDINMLAFSALRGFADAKNVTIYNASPDSKVTVFEKVKLSDVSSLVQC